MPDTRPRESSTWTWPLLTSGVLVLLSMLVLKQDVSWDLRNYHLYTASALMSGRFADDVAVGQLQTWHNPALDVPFAWMVGAGWPGWLVSAWLALPAWVALAFALRLMDRVWPRGQGAIRTVAAGVIGVTGAAVMSNLGTTFNDAFVAAGVLAALWWVMDSRDRRGPWATWLPAGLLVGLVAGLKLTGAMYCVGMVAMALAASGLRTLPARMLALAVGGIVGAAITAGPWAWYLWQHYGNPLFPYFNQWFQSPDAWPTSHADGRFVPHGIDAWLVPFHLLFDNMRYSESRLADPRLLLGLASLVGASVLARRTGDARPRMLLAFALASLITWILLYGIYRYVLALELLCAMAFMGMLSRWQPRIGGRVAWVAAVLVLVAVTNRPSWGRVPFHTPMVSVQFPSLPGDAMVLLAADQPLGFAVTALPRQVPALSINNNFMSPQRCTRLQARVESRVRAHAGPLLLLRERPREAVAMEPWRAYGLIVDGACKPVSSNLAELEVCPLRRAITAPVVCATTSGDR